MVAAKQNIKLSDLVPKHADIVLTPMEEIWEVSSVKASDVEEACQDDATGREVEEQQLEKLEQYVDDAWDAIFGNESAGNR